MKIGLINVGVNTSHGTLQSPIYDDGRFEFVPIPLPSSFQNYCVFPRYEELHSPNGRAFSEFIPHKFLTTRTDNDPDLTSIPFTYGDWPTKNSRAANLVRLNPGDQLFFLARLVNRSHGSFTRKAGFYFVGFLEIEHVFTENKLIDMARFRRFDERFEMIKRNGHMLMMKDFTDLWLRERPLGWKGSRVFLGSTRSKRFPYAVPFNRTLANKIMLDRHGNKLIWPDDQTELQRIGSYTRSCRIIEARSSIDRLWKVIRSYNDCASL